MTKIKTLWFVIFGRRSGLSIDDRIFIKHSLEYRDFEIEEKFASIVEKKYNEQTTALAEIINTQFANVIAEMKAYNRRIRSLEKRADDHDKKYEDHDKRIEIIEQIIKVA